MEKGGRKINIPIVGMVVTISPSLSLYRMVVLPAASRPTIRIRISFLPHILSKSFEILIPISPVKEGEFKGQVRCLFFSCCRFFFPFSFLFPFLIITEKREAVRQDDG